MTLSSATAITRMPPSLTRLSNGEYTASSVFAAPVQAVRRGLVRQADGNYGIDSPVKVAAWTTPAARTSSGMLGALSSLRLGG